MVLKVRESLQFIEMRYYFYLFINKNNYNKKLSNFLYNKE